MRIHVFKFCLVLLVSVMVLAAVAFVQVAPSDAAETSYGAGANPTGDPIGGGAGYSDIITSGDYTVSTKADLLRALSSVASGQRIFIPETATIDLTGVQNLVIPAGVTLCSNRGYNGSTGGLIKQLSNSGNGVGWPEMMLLRAGARVTGLMIQGPNSTTSDYGACWSGVFALDVDNTEIDNCEIYNWPHAGVMTSGATQAGWTRIHHNYIHNCRQNGLGYGVFVGRGWALIEANIFDYGRHFISGDRGTPTTNYEARYNIFESNCTHSLVDCHGGNDVGRAGVPAGGTLLIHHNTFKQTGRNAVHIRGIPANGAEVYANWVQYGSESYAKTIFEQSLDNLGLKPYVKMSVHDNWYGSSSPPGTDSGTTPPVAPAPPRIPVAPTLSSPTDGANVSGASVTFQWNASPGATKYFLIVSTDPSLTVVQKNSSVRKYWGQLGDVTRYTVSGFPDNGKTYYWWVWAGNANGWCSQSQVVANGGWSFTNRP